MSGDGSKDTGPDSDTGLLSQSCFDLMMIELVPMAQRLAEQIYDEDQAADTGNPSSSKKMDDEELKEAMFYRLEALGYRVGLGVVESLTANLPLPSRTNPLDTIKFLCKDLWTAVFRKQIDNLKTNHRGVFVLTDNAFTPLRRCALEAGKMEEARARAGPFLHFPAGVVRGALAALGFEATVSAEVAGMGLPGAVFQIRMAGAK